MKASEIYTKSLKEVLEEMELLDVKVHTDEEGTIKAVELRYGEKKRVDRYTE